MSGASEADQVFKTLIDYIMIIGSNKGELELKTQHYKAQATGMSVCGAGLCYFVTLTLFFNSEESGTTFCIMFERLSSMLEI